MRQRVPSLQLALWSMVVLAAVPARLAAEPAEGNPAALEFFEKRVRPVLVEHCYKCHSAQAKKPKGGLLLDSLSGLLKGGDNGPALVPEQPEKSRLIHAVGYTSVDLQMPPKGKLPDTAIADLSAWVKMGAPWPKELGTKAAVAEGAFDLHQRRRQHWAWQPVRPDLPPSVRDAAWPAGAVDRFLLAAVEAHGIEPAAMADRRTLLRRLWFDLIGLPPAAEDVEAFVRDDSPDAFARLVDRLLASPHFGERWGRHWLDLVRYAETRGHEFDYPAPNAYQYRDYIVRALNADVPYNQFVTEHVAGDLLDAPRRHPVEGFNESILGTSFWFLGEELHSPVDVRQDEADRFDNRIDVLTKAFLGLTVSCARCHDHKFDAISTRDYYALFGFLQSSSYRLARFEALDHNRRIARELDALRQAHKPVVLRALADALRPGVDRLAVYLLAAREARSATAAEEKAAQLAGGAGVDPVLLTRWVAHLNAAARDPKDPLHAWTKVSDEPGQTAKAFAALHAEWKALDAKAAAALNRVELVLDYARTGPQDWIQDEAAFGPRPVRPGDVRFGTDAARPVTRVFDYAAAHSDPAWDGLRFASGAENDAGPMGELRRPGRTLRTPTFALTTGKLFYLVKGTGHAYAAVDSHVMINGPLHRQLVLAIKAGDDFRWVAHDLAAYQGHRTHVEFTAADGSDFAVALIVQATNAPGAAERPNRSLVQILAAADGLPQTLAAAYGRLFRGVLDDLAADRIAGSPDPAGRAALANWLVNHPQLFSRDEKQPAMSVAAAAGPFFAEQSRLLGQVRKESRLAMALLDGDGEDEHVFIRGSPRALGEVVPRRFLEALAGPQGLAIRRGSGRLELARQMTDPALNPFLARVMVNRVWHHLFGRGLVASTDNFGVLGEQPTHPELLDYLAGRFVEEGWSVKKLIRSLVLTRAYRMSSDAGTGDEADPENRLMHRMRVRRLEGEAIRDAILAVAGRLDQRLYGPPVPVYLTPFMDGRGRPPQSGPLDGDGRRSLYTAVRRNFLPPMMLAFDTPAPFSTVGRRTVSNVPAQALILMNDPFVHQQSERWGRRAAAATADPRQRVRAMYLDAFARTPSETELADCLAFVARQARQHTDGLGEAAAWTDLAHVLFNVKEFIYLR